MKTLQFGTYEHLELRERIEARGIAEIKQIRFYNEDKELIKRKARTRRSILDTPHSNY